MADHIGWFWRRQRIADVTPNRRNSNYEDEGGDAAVYKLHAEVDTSDIWMYGYIGIWDG